MQVSRLIYYYKHAIHIAAYLLFIGVFLLPVTPVYAETADDVEGIPINTNDVKAIRGDKAWWDPFWDSCTAGDSSDTPSKLVGKDNVERSYKYFALTRKLQPHQAAGIVGNLQQESGPAINPESNQKGGPGRGIAQWSEGGRWDALVRWAEKQNRKPLDLETQLDYIWHEMTKVSPWDETLQPLKDSKDYKEATLVFMEKFEKAGDPRMENRYEYARKVLETYGKNSGPKQANTNNTAPGSPCGGTGILVEGYSFPVAPRTKRSYTNLPCNTKLIRYTDRFGKSTTIMNCHPGDGSPAFDLFYNGVEGVPVYAITDGKIINVDTNYTNPSSSDKGGKACASIMFQANNGNDKSYYWYGHILNPTVDPGRTVKAGQKIAVVATGDYGRKCWGGTPHLHIDRGCKDPKGNPVEGGSDNCRDPAFQGDIKKIWEGLPEK